MDRASEDFVSYQGKVCKLGVTKLDENASEIMSYKHFVTSKVNSGDCSCDVYYEPKYETGESMNYIVVQFR